MKIEGKHKQTFDIEYEFKETENRYFDDDPRIEIQCTFSKKKLRAYTKGVKATVKYLAKMKRLGFEPVEQEGGKNNEMVTEV